MGYNFSGNPVDYQAPAPKAVAPPPPPSNTGPTGFWGRIAQVGVGKVNLYNAYHTTVEHKPALNANNSPLKTAATDVGHVGKAVGSAVASPFSSLAKTTNQVINGKTYNDINNKALDMINRAQQQSKADFNAGKISKADYTTVLSKIKEAHGKISDEVQKNAKEVDHLSVKRTAGDLAQVASLFVGGGETKELLTGASSLFEGLLTNAGAAVLGGTGAKVSQNPNVSTKELAKAVPGEAAFGAGTALLGSAGGKIVGGAKTALNKDRTVTNTINKAKTDVLLQKGEQANKAEAVIGKQPKTKLLTAGEKQPVKGEGFTMTDKPNTTAISKGQEINQLESRLTKFQQGKLNITPEQAKTDAARLADLKSGKATAAEQLTSKSSATEVGKSKEVSTSTKLTKPSVPKETTPLKNTNKNQTKASQIITGTTKKTKTTGLLNPEQGLSRAGHTDAAALVRETGSKFSAAHERGERILAELPKTEGYNPNVDEFAKDVESKTGNTAAHKQVIADYQDTGRRGVAAGSLEAPRDETYFPRNYKSDTGRTGDFQGGLRKTGSFSKSRVQAGEFGEGGDKYVTRAEANTAARKAGLRVPDATTAEIHAHNITQREKAIANAEFLSKAEKTTMKDERPMMVSVAPGKNVGSKYSDYNTSLIPGRAVHPEAVTAVKGLMDTGGGRNLLTRVNVGTKRLVTLNGVIHDLNYARSSLGEQGLKGTVKGLLHSPTKYTEEERAIRDEAASHGAVFSGGGKTNIYDQSLTGSNELGRKVNGVLGKIRSGLDKRVFGIGDRLGMSTYKNVKAGLVKRGLSEDEAGKVAADAANRVMFTQRAGESSQTAREAGKVAFFAKNFFQSTLQKATAATGISKNRALSEAAQRGAQKQAAKAIARQFTYLFAAAQAINYRATGHSTFQNKDSKISPVFYVDKSTGKTYHLTNWYGQIGELMHLTDPKAITNKLSPGLGEISRLISNQDQLGSTAGGTVRDTSAPGIKQWGQMAGNALEHLVTPLGIDANRAQQMFGAGGQPGKVSAANFLGFGTSPKDQSGMEKQIDKLYNAKLPANVKSDQQLSTLKAVAANDIKKGNANSSAVQQLKSQLTPAQFRAFTNTGSLNLTQIHFQKLSPDQKFQIIEQYSPDQLKELDLKNLATSLVDSSSKTTITSLQSKGFSTQRIQQDLQKIGVDNNQLKQLKDEAKKQASAKAKAAAKQPKFVNPFVR